MKKKDIEKMLKSEIEQNVPFVLPNVLKTPCKVEEVIELAKPKKEDKPYFQFRYMYASLVILSVLVVGLGIFLPNTKSNGLFSSGVVVAEEFDVYTTIATPDIVVGLTTDEEDIVSSLVINGISQPVMEGRSVDEAVTYIVEVLKEAGQLDSSITVDVESKNSYRPHEDEARIKSIIEKTLSSYGVNIDL